jgi:hypothetical protein
VALYATLALYWADDVDPIAALSRTIRGGAANAALLEPGMLPLWPMIVVILIVFLISFFTVQTARIAVTTRFGKFLRVAQPGLNWKYSPRRNHGHATQPAHESLFNRRLRVLSPAVRTNDRRSPRRRSKKLRAAL